MQFCVMWHGVAWCGVVWCSEVWSSVMGLNEPNTVTGAPQYSVFCILKQRGHVRITHHVLSTEDGERSKDKDDKNLGNRIIAEGAAS